jgi:hypothetical protein
VECLLLRKKFKSERDDAFSGMAFARMIDGSDSDGHQEQKEMMR